MGIPFVFIVCDCSYILRFIKKIFRMDLIKLLPVPNNWNRKEEIYEVHEERLSASDLEYDTVRTFLTGICLDNLEKITRVQNPYIYHRYQIRKEEYKARGIPYHEKELLHATSVNNVQSILKDNFDWKLVKRAKYGKGVSFSPYALYANRECSKTNGRQRALIVTKVLIGRQHCGHQNLQVPIGDYDTTTGGGNNCQVYVKYYDDEFYPEYVAYYHL